MRPAWWHTRAEAVHATRPVFSPPEHGHDRQSEEEGLGGEHTAASEPPQVVSDNPVTGDPAERVWRVACSEPTIGGASVTDLHIPWCPGCGQLAAGNVAVIAAEDTGWCVGTLCGCAHPFFSRESVWFTSVQQALHALQTGIYLAG